MSTTSPVCLSPAVDRAICSYSPISVSPEAGQFAREVVAQVAPASAARAKALLFASSKLCSFGLAVGYGCDKEVLFHPDVIERFIVVGTAGLSPATTRTLRSNLRFLANRVLSPRRARPVPLSRERAKDPYTTAEIDAYLVLAHNQPTYRRQMRAVGLISLGAGAGLMGIDLRSVRGHDVVRRSGGVVVSVGGSRDRVVPVLKRYHELVVASAVFAGNGYVTGGEEPARRNVTAPLVSKLSGGIHLERIDTGRLRSTWLSECARLIGLRGFLDAAGVSCSQRLGDVVATLAPPSEEEMVALLGTRP